MTEKYHLPLPAHPPQCTAAPCESTTTAALSSPLSASSPPPPPRPLPTDTFSPSLLSPPFFALLARAHGPSSSPLPSLSLLPPLPLSLSDSVPQAEIGSVTDSGGSLTESPGKTSPRDLFSMPSGSSAEKRTASSLALQHA